jgi:hypothetical protein
MNSPVKMDPVTWEWAADDEAIAKKAEEEAKAAEEKAKAEAEKAKAEV